jgi:branched-chain amino acid transport system permease protein
VQDYYLGFTFLTLSMLVIGGSGSIWGALVGTLLVISVGQVLLMMEQGKAIFGLSIDLPNGARAIFIAATLVVALLWRSSGVTNGKEFAFPNFKKKSN